MIANHSTTNVSALVDFTLEILHGCRWHCAGCKVDRNAQNGFESGDYDRLLQLFSEFENTGHVLSNLGLGPTDFMVADNTMSMMPLLVPMMDKFRAITLQCTFMEKPETIEDIARQIRPFLAGREVKFVTPIDPKQFKNKKLLDTIQRNRDLFVGMVPEMVYSKTNYVCNLTELREFSQNPFHNNNQTLEEFCVQFHETSGYHLDLVVAEGRLPMNDINNRLKLKSALKYLNQLYNEGVTQSSRQAINFTLGDHHEGFDKDYVYRAGVIYNPPFVGEPLVMFETEFGVDRSTPWTVESLDKYDQQSTIDSIEYLDRTDTCSTCEFAPLCVGRGVIKTMMCLREKRCMAPRDALIATRTQCA